MCLSVKKKKKRKRKMLLVVWDKSKDTSRTQTLCICSGVEGGERERLIRNLTDFMALEGMIFARLLVVLASACPASLRQDTGAKKRNAHLCHSSQPCLGGESFQGRMTKKPWGTQEQGHACTALYVFIKKMCLWCTAQMQYIYIF